MTQTRLVQDLYYSTPDDFKVCPDPLRFGQDQYRCNVCGIVWDVDEERPACHNPTK